MKQAFDYMLKNFLVFIIICTLFPAKMMATAQQSEIIFINGKRHVMLSCPLETDSVIREALKEVRPAETVSNTSLWRGYVGYWSIQKGNLYVDSLQFELEDFTTKTIVLKNESIFSAYTDEYGVKASWFSGELRLVQGKLIRYEHMGFQSSFEKESFLNVKEGVVTNSRKYKNKVLCKNTIENPSVYKAFNDAFVKEFPDAKPVSMRISYSKVNAKGKPTEVKVDSNDRTENKEKIENFVRSYLLKNHILGVYRINNNLFFETWMCRLGKR